MNFLKVATYYPEFVRFATSRVNGFGDLPYEKQMNHLFSFAFGWSNFWKTHLEAERGINATEIVYNIESSQKKWAEEHGVKFGEDWKNDIFEAQIEYYKPQIIFFEDYFKPLTEYKRMFPFIKFIVMWDGLAEKDIYKYRGADMMASGHKETTDFYHDNGIKSHLFLFGFEPSLLTRLKKRPPLYDVSFVGSINIGRRRHNKRITLLNELSKHIEISSWITGANHVNLLSIQMLKCLATGLVPQAFALNKILKSNRGKAFGLDMFQILADSKLTLNTHIDSAGDYAANVRLYEATAVGTCLVTDWKKNLNQLFEIDKEVVAYKSKEELVEKVKWLLDNENERKKIAIAGQQRTLKDYSLKGRILGLYDSISY